MSAAVSASPDEEISLPAALVPQVDIPSTNVNFKTDPLTLHNDVTAIKDIKLDPDAEIVLDIKLSNVFLTDGQGIPNVDIDFSSLFNIEGGNKVNLKDLVLTKDNGWKATKTFAITSLAKTEYNSSIAIDENLKVSGNVSINDPKTTKTQFNASSGDIALDIAISFNNLKIAAARVDIKSVSLDKTSKISLTSLDDIQLPEEIKDVKSISLDPAKPFTICITPNNLEILETKNIPYSIELTFPESMDVDGAVNGKITFDGDLANGPINKDIIVKRITPTVSGGALSFDGTVEAKSIVNAQNLSISSVNLPKDQAGDVSFSVNIKGEPAISDYFITINEISESAKMDETLDIDVSEIGDFGSFTVIPDGTPEITMKINLPDVAGLSIVPGTEGVKVQLPDVIVFDGTGIASDLAFDSDKNTITIKNSFPSSITLPVKQLDIKPVKDGDKYVVKSKIGVDGKIRIAEADVNQKDVEGLLDSGFGIVIDIPEIKASSIELNDNFSVDFDEEYDIVLISKNDFPEELISLDEAVLDNASLNFEADFAGLGSGTFDVDLTLTLPEFVTPSVIPLTGKIKNGSFKPASVTIEKLSGIDLSKGKDIEGSITVEGSITASGSRINLNELGEKVNINLNASIADSDGNLGISKASGKFKYDINSTSEVKIDDVPEMLKSEDVCLDLLNPQIYLEMNSNIGIPINGTLTITPVINGKEASAITVTNVSLPYSSKASGTSTKKYCICNKASDCAAGYEPLTADVSGLLKRIPDELKIDVKAAVDQNVQSVIEPAADYTFDIDYRIEVPMTFGDDFKFSCTTTLDMSEASSLTSMGKFSLKGKAVNDSPLGLDIKLELLDGNGGIIPQSGESIISIAPEGTSDIAFSISPTDKSREIRSGQLTITATAKPGVALKESHSIQLTDLVATAPEGISL